MIPVWLYGLLRFYLPGPCAIALPWLTLTTIPSLKFDGQSTGINILLGIVGVVILIVEGWQSPRRIFEPLTRCPMCGRGTLAHTSPKDFFSAFTCRSCARHIPNPLPPLALLFGTAFTCSGLYVTLVPWVDCPSGGIPDPRGMSMSIFGVIMMLAGLMVLGLWRPVIRGLRRVWPGMNQVPWGEIFGGTVASLAGTFFICLGMLSGNGESMPAGRSPVVAAGGAFLCCGLAILNSTLQQWTPPWVATFLGLLAVGCLLALPAMLMFGMQGKQVILTGLIIGAAIVIRHVVAQRRKR